MARRSGQGKPFGEAGDVGKGVVSGGEVSLNLALEELFFGTFNVNGGRIGLCLISTPYILCVPFSERIGVNIYS